MNYWKVILATVVIFGAGVLTGGLLVGHVDNTRVKKARHGPATGAMRSATNAATPLRLQEIPMPRVAEKMSKQFVHQLNDRLQLTPGQRAKIEDIIAEGQERNHELWTNVAPRMRSVMQEVNRRIRAELTPEQQAQFEDLLKRPPRRLPATTNATPALTNAPGA